MTLTKGNLIQLLRENKMPMDTPVQIHLECTNNDTTIMSNSIVDIDYNKHTKAIFINGTYDENED